jgi:hypothetical protein
VIQVDVARFVVVTPWLKITPPVEAYNILIYLHFLVELLVCLVCAVENAHRLEYTPQRGIVAHKEMPIPNRMAVLSSETRRSGTELPPSLNNFINSACQIMRAFRVQNFSHSHHMPFITQIACSISTGSLRNSTQLLAQIIRQGRQSR